MGCAFRIDICAKSDFLGAPVNAPELELININVNINVRNNVNGRWRGNLNRAPTLIE